MITGITGLPRSGKSLMCVYDILRPLVGTSVTHEGKTYPRVIYSNIDGLLLDHEKIDAEGINTWSEWCPPGAVLAIDEVQDFWPPRPNGSKVPLHIEKLATHGHSGIDVIYMTQHPMMIDQNLRALTGRHLHVRRQGNMPAAMVYEWDHCSRQLLYSNSLSKVPWIYPRKGYQLYRSATVHTKMKRKLPAILWAFPVLIAVLAYIGPKVYAAATGANRAPVVAKAAPVEKNAPAPVLVPSAPIPAPRASSPAVPITPSSSMPVVFGCARLRNVCRCYDEKTGALHQVEPGVCEARIEPAVPFREDGELLEVDQAGRSIAYTDAAELDTLAFMVKRRASLR